ncbi:hypothetical protein [Roseobacter sp. S98]|uniref:hypothetical protein n=1 Tax=Roseobacter algicola (ex Choi et al. 2025) (nom. illeg.) TaxID=3092138 RepID=UPI0035C76F40
MADFETALELVREAKTSKDKAALDEGFRQQGERIDKRKEQVAADQAKPSDVILAALVLDNPQYAARLRRLNNRLETHQSAVIEALLDNQERLDEANLRLQLLLDTAFVLPDGRRVFKSEDGITVIDEHGAQVGADELDPDMIDDRYPTAEAWLAAKEHHQKISEERQDLLEYQSKLDQAQILIDQGGLSADDFDDLESLMNEDVPQAVKQRLPSPDPARADTQNLDSGFGNSMDLNGLDLSLPSKGR